MRGKPVQMNSVDTVRANYCTVQVGLVQVLFPSRRLLQRAFLRLWRKTAGEWQGCVADQTGGPLTGSFGLCTEVQAGRVSQGTTLSVLYPKLFISSVMKRNHRLRNGFGILLVWGDEFRGLISLCRDMCDMCLFLIFLFQRSFTHFWNCWYPR